MSTDPPDTAPFQVGTKVAVFERNRLTGHGTVRAIYKTGKIVLDGSPTQYAPYGTTPIAHPCSDWSTSHIEVWTEEHTRLLRVRMLRNRLLKLLNSPNSFTEEQLTNATRALVHPEHP